MIADYIKTSDVHTSHPGAMLFDEEKRIPSDWKKILVKNTINNNLMFFKKGDGVFRVNPIFSPQLDFISAFFLVVGVVVFLFQNKSIFLILFLHLKYYSYHLY